MWHLFGDECSVWWCSEHAQIEAIPVIVVDIGMLSYCRLFL